KVLTVEELGQMTPEERAHIMLQQPQVDDIYSAQVSKFSEYFDGDAFGLMRVIEVKADSIVVITEDAAWPDEADGSVEELAGDFSTIGWDFEEKIVLQIADLEGYLKDGSIVATRRLTSQEIKDFLSDK
ncbi:MAG: hypothetical protein ACRCWP_05005, partial [Shewanella sp.]